MLTGCINGSVEGHQVRPDALALHAFKDVQCPIVAARLLATH